MTGAGAGIVSGLEEATDIGGVGGFVDVTASSPKHIVVAPPGEARTLVDGLDKLISVLIRVLIVPNFAEGYLQEMMR
jgi:hypothetical protein